MFIQWDDKFSTGVDYFDNQHKQLFDMVNTLHDGIKGGYGKEMLGVTFRGLLEYAASHFAEEEKVMIANNYPQYAAHKNEHVKLTDQVVAFYNDYEAGIKIMTLEVLGFLSDWLKHHIAESDKSYGPFLNSKGFKQP